jgi:hypothetical protein
MPCYQTNPQLTAEVTGPCPLYFGDQAPVSPPVNQPGSWAYFFAQGEVSNIGVPNPHLNHFTGQATLQTGVTLTGALSTGLGLRTAGGQILFEVWVNLTDLDPPGIIPCDLSPWA